MPLPDLTQMQKDSYEWFLREGIGDLFEELSPIVDYSGELTLHMVNYFIDEPKFDEHTCREKNVTYEAPIRVLTQLKNERTGDVKEQEVFLGDIPLMTTRGTFVINGVERVVVSQIIRSPGAFFTAKLARGRKYYGAKIIPNRGAWIEIETDLHNVIWVKVDRKRKAPITTLLRAFGYESDDDIRELLRDVNTHPQINYVENALAKDAASNSDEAMIEIYKRIRPGDLATVDNARSLIESMFFNFDRYDLGPVGRYKYNERFSLEHTEKSESKESRILTKEDMARIVKEVIRLSVHQEDPDDIDHLGNRRIKAIGELVQNRFRIGLARMERIVRDRMSTYDPSTMSGSRLINARPMIGAIREFFMSSQLSQFMDQTNPLAELEHKRRISAMGPGGLSRDRAGFEVRDVHPTHYGRICPIQTPEGPNIGLVGHLASYARINQYGFLETPYRKVLKEVANDGKAAVDEIARGDQGEVKNGDKITKEQAASLKKSDAKTILIKPRVTTEIQYLNAFEEGNVVTTAVVAQVDADGYFSSEKVELRDKQEPGFDFVEKVDFVDVSSKQVVSIATSLIPFLEHDDASRALMGSNMQRQAVPLITPEAPIVGTGIEEHVARNSGHMILAEEDGEITKVGADIIELTGKSGDVHTYRVNRYLRSNNSSAINQRILVTTGQKVKKGDVLSDGPSTDKGEIALGRNVLVAYMVWDGFNYEDAIILSDRLVKDDVFTSVHVEQHTCTVRETKLGPELITSDIPNVSEDKLKNLDHEGVIRIGAEVSMGDILVGKITPKGETELSAEEKLLRAIFGEKARDVRDTSLSLEHGEHGKIVDIKVFSAENGDKLSPGVIKSVQVGVADMRKIQVGDKMAGRHGNKGVVSRIVKQEDMPFLEDGTPVDIILSPLGVISRMNLGQLLETHLGLAANAMQFTVATPVLNGVTEPQIKEVLREAGFSDDGKSQLYDGRTGDSFDHTTTVGWVYMLKLVHMVEDKLHQRSIGPYSLITQQPLGGKAQFGGQRFGEMEVWALEAYGAGHMLQEILTIKSDDIPGRSKAFESIIKGEPISKRNIPESFQVLLRELKGLCLDVSLMNKNMSGGYDIVSQDKKTGDDSGTPPPPPVRSPRTRVKNIDR